jgi:arsenate reductase (glutaredoxin)
MLKIYHNGECSKCRGALEILIENGIPFEPRFYLAEPLSKEELKGLLTKLNLPAKDIVRTSEPLYTEKFEGKELSEDQWLDALVEHPILLQRPIVEKDSKAIIARPPERVFEMI